MSEEEKTIPFRIEVLRVDRNDYTVISDGILIDKLTWEEMLGYFAQITLIGTKRFTPTRLLENKRSMKKEDLVMGRTGPINHVYDPSQEKYK